MLQLDKVIASRSIQNYLVLNNHYYGTRFLTTRSPWMAYNYTMNYLERALGCVDSVRMEQELRQLTHSNLDDVWHVLINFIEDQIYYTACM